MKKTLCTITTICCLILYGCGKRDETKNEENKDGAIEETTSNVGTLNISEGINNSVAKNLAVTSVTSSQSQAAMKTGTLAVGLTSSEGDDYYSKLADMKTTMTTEKLSECTAAIPQEFSLAQGNLAHAPCFGPGIMYQNHPDTNQHGDIGNGDAGMFWNFAELDASSGQGCSSMVMNNLMGNVGRYANTANGLQAMVACAGRIAKVKLGFRGHNT